MPAKQLEFLMGHEVLHCVYDHMGRRGERDPQLWNIADDYCVNQDLLDQRIGEKIPVGLYEPKYRGWSAEEVYDDLYKNAEKINIDDLVDQLLDEHLDGDGEGEGGEDGDEKKDGKGRPKLSEEERKQIRDEIKEAVMTAAQTAGSGNLPSGVKRMIKDLTTPQLDWRALLQQQIQSTLRTDYTWARASRKGWDMDAIMPGSDFDKEIDICVAIDTSGSMSDTMLKDILSEVKGIMESYTSFRLHLWSFDTEVYPEGARVFTADNLDDIMDWEPLGGGGTDFDSIFNFLKKEGRVPNRLIVFTDGYPYGSWGDSDYCDTTWIIHGDPNPNPPFGTFALYDDHKKR
jgi:predicted metal-dependent peptidase